MRWAGAVVLLAACSERVAIVPDELALQVVAPVQEIEFGRAVPLTIVRSWRKGLTAQEWGPQALAPLALRLLHAERASNATHVQDTRRYAAYVFGRDVVRVQVPAFRARAGDGSERSVAGPELSFRVRSTLSKDDDGVAELPGGLLPEPTRWSWRFVLVPAATLMLLASVTWLRRHVRVPWRRPGPSMAVVSAHEDALRRLGALRTGSGDDTTTDTFYLELAVIVRAYVAARFAVPSGERTTPEIMDAPALLALPAPTHSAAGDALAACDLVKFARVPRSQPQRERALADAENFVRATASRGAT